VGGKRKVKTKVIDFDKPALRLPGLDMSKTGLSYNSPGVCRPPYWPHSLLLVPEKEKSPGGEALLPESVLSSAAVAACDKSRG